MKNGEPKIESGIPVPPARKTVHGYSALLRTLKKGDSVLLPLTQTVAANKAQYALGAGNYVSRAEGKGTRIWRTS